MTKLLIYSIVIGAGAFLSYALELSNPACYFVGVGVGLLCMRGE